MNTYWKMLCYSVLVLVGCSLMGCATVETKVVYQDRLVFPDDSKIVDCDISAPPAKEVYLKDYTSTVTVEKPMVVDGVTIPPKLVQVLKNYEVREGLVTKYAKVQTDHLVQCNVRMKNIREEKAALKLKLAPKDNSSAKE